MSFVTNAATKTQRLRDALARRQPDRIPAGEAFWTGFLKRCRALWGEGFDPYRAFDLDYVIFVPNLDPRIQQFEPLPTRVEGGMVGGDGGSVPHALRPGGRPRHVRLLGTV